MAGMWAAIADAEKRDGFERVSLSGHAQAFYIESDDYEIGPLVFCGDCARQESLPAGQRWHVEDYSVGPSTYETDPLVCDGCECIIGYREP